MLTIKSMQVLYKESALMESLVTHKTKVRLIINDKIYESTEAPVKQRLATWNQQAFPLIQLPKNVNSWKFQFQFIKNNQPIGKAKCSIILGKNKKDCLDIANKNFQIVGKFVYHIQWKSPHIQSCYNDYGNIQQKQINYPVFSKKYSQIISDPGVLYKQHQQPQGYELANLSKSEFQYHPPELNKPYFKHIQTSRYQHPQYKQQSKKSSSSIFNLFGCFGSIRSKKNPFFVIYPIEIEQKDLPYAPPLEVLDPFPIQYYSKGFKKI